VSPLFPDRSIPVRRPQHLRVASVSIDLVAIFAALSLAGIWSGRELQSVQEIGLAIGAHGLLFGTVWVLVTARLGTYRVPLRGRTGAAVRSVVEAWATTWGLAGLLDITLLQHQPFEIWWALAFGLVLLVAVRLMLRNSALAAGTGRPRTLVVGACHSAFSLTASKAAQRDMEFVGFVPFSGELAEEMPHLLKLGNIGALQQTLVDERIDLALVCPSDHAITGEVHAVFESCDDIGLSAQYFPSFLDLRHLHVGLAWNDNRAGLSFHTLPNHSLAQFVKRGMDVVGATLGIVGLLPVFLGCAVGVKLSSSGPFLFRQTRVGRNGETFTCLKFRTMRQGAHHQQELLRSASTQDGPAFKIPNDPRITPFGNILRKFSLDELPQLFNVLLGDMSLVGPRPPIPSEVEKYTWWQRRRIAVKPGLTCVWQVWGRNRVSFKRWVEMDLYYIDNWSLWLDIRLILHTFRAVIAGTGM